MARSSYGALLRTPAVSWLLGSALVARLPIAVTRIALVLAVTDEHHSDAAAGAVGAGLVFPQGGTQAVYGRLADKLGRRRVLRVLALANAGAGIALAFCITSPAAVLFPVAAFMGATSPPVIATMRAAWSGLVS